MLELEPILNGLSPGVTLGLLAASFAGSFATVALGIGGGSLMLAVMATLLPPAALIPVHGVVQLGSNVLRAALLLRQMHWPPFAAFAAGTLGGVALGGPIVVSLPPAIVQIGVGAFVIWSVLLNPPAWLSRAAGLTGLISSFLTMFFGATGVFVANFTKSLALGREAHVATHAGLMTLQHLAKILAFGLLGFAYGPWAWIIGLLIGVGFLGTLAGRLVLVKLTDARFKLALDAILILISLRLIWAGVTSLAG